MSVGVRNDMVDTFTQEKVHFNVSFLSLIFILNVNPK